MQLPAARMAAPLAAVIGFALFLVPSPAFGQQPAPTTPTIRPPTLALPRFTSAYPGVPALTQPPAVPPPANGQVPPAPPPGNGQPPDPVPLPELSLGECIATAMQRQPALRALAASQAAGEAGQRGLNNIGRVGQALSPDLPIRKEQAARGVIAFAADQQKLHNEIVQDVTRLYFTVVYARQQEVIAEDVAATLEQFVKIGREQVKVPNSGVTQLSLSQMEIGYAEARALLATSQVGQKQAMAALREVMGVEHTYAFRPKDKDLPVLAQNVPLTRDQVVGMATTQRPELALAAAGVDAFRLEVYAQSKIPFRRAVPTFASGSDIHARDVPMASRGKEYRPGAIAPEMPTQLVGTKYDRVCRAMALSQRAEAVYEKARGLIVLEAETAFHDLELTSQRVTLNKVKQVNGAKIAEIVRDTFADSKEKESLLRGYAFALKAQSDYVEAVYQHLLALAALERVTAGGVRPAFPGRLNALETTPAVPPGK